MGDNAGSWFKDPAAGATKVCTVPTFCCPYFRLGIEGTMTHVIATEQQYNAIYQNERKMITVFSGL